MNGVPVKRLRREMNVRVNAYMVSKHRLDLAITVDAVLSQASENKRRA